MERAPTDAGRTCLGCRRTLPRASLVRIVRGPAGELVFDPEGRLPGRGAWVCPAASCLDALAPGALAHVLRAPVDVPAREARRAALAAALERRAANLLGVSRKARAVVFGAAGAKAALREGRAGLLLLAGDLPPDTLASWRSQAGAVPVALAASAAALGSLAGAEPVAVVAVRRSGLADALARVLEQTRAISPQSCDNKDSLSVRDLRGRRRSGPRREEATGQ